ncbi:MAG: DNA gyrase subunit A [Pseudomonadota bacterium]
MAENTPTSSSEKDIAPISIEQEMKSSYLDYAMSVIVSRALPDVRDGLKPVHRRILYSCHENGYEWNKPYRKSARIVGDVMGKYHPHGDGSIYDALVRMAQDFSMRDPLIDGQGNFGSMDGDPPAAMRYTEARLAKLSSNLLADIDRDTVDFQANYDDSDHEPQVLPSRLPNLLINGAGGIAVGMATNIPPHNLDEVISATLALIENPDLTVPELMEHVPGPDFPTGAMILGASVIRQAYETGRGSILIRAKSHVEEIRKDREAIIITEIPYQVNKSSLIEKIADHVRNKRIEGIADLRDETDRDGVRIVIEIKRDAMPEVVLNQLYRFTPLQTSFGINMLALNGGRPEQLGLKDILSAFIRFREEVITRRTKFDLGKARDRAHILVGLVLAVTHVDEVVALIRGSSSPQEAREKLLARSWPAEDVASYIELVDAEGAVIVDGGYRLSETQVKAILDLRLHRLTALGREDLTNELKEIAERIAELLDILRHRDKLYAVLKEELVAIREEFATPRRTEINLQGLGGLDDEDLIQREEMVVTVTHSGYIKRVPLSVYRAQRRGGKGRAGMSMRDEDFLSQVFVTSTHTPVLFFSSRGIVYRMKVWRLPPGSPQSLGKALVNLLPLEAGETITTILPLPENEDDWADLHVVFATLKGNVRRNAMSDFANVPSNGKIAIKFEEDSGDRLIGVMLCDEDNDVFLGARSGKCIRFPANDIRLFKGRTSIGVRGMRLADGDEVISLSILTSSKGLETETRDAYLRAASWKSEPGEATLSADAMAELAAREQLIVTVTENGYGKRSSAYEYRTTGRGGVGIANIDTSERNGEVVASGPILDSDQLMLVTNKGKLIRTPVNDIRIAGRATQGVTLFNVDDGERVVAVAKIGDVGGDDLADKDEETDAEPDVSVEATEDIAQTSSDDGGE